MKLFSQRFCSAGAVLVFSTLIYLLLFQSAQGGDHLMPAEFSITNKIIAQDIEPIGANLTPIAKGTNFSVNNHVWNSGFEPIVMRKFIRINRAGENWFEWDQEGGPGYSNLAWTGLFNGATVRFYRIVDRKGKPLAYGGLKDMANIDGADHVVFLGEAKIPLKGDQFPDGGYIANDKRDGDTQNDMERVYIDNSGLGLRFGDYVYIKLKTTHIGAETSPPDLREKFSGLKGFFTAVNGKWTPSLVPHPAEIPPEFEAKGETCLRVDFPETGSVGLGQWLFYPSGQGQGQYYSQLRPGATYTVSVWMRQEGLGDGGRVRFGFRGAYRDSGQKDSWTVTKEWKKYSYDFVAPAYPTEGPHIAPRLQFTGPGTVWMDNYVLYRNDEKHEFRPFSPHEISLDEIMASFPENGKKPAMRFYNLIFHDSSVKAMFTDYGNPKYRVSWNAGVGKSPAATIAQVMYWAYKTGNSPEDRVVPYLTCNEEYTEDEWKALVEYLGVPYDPKKDTPESKPYAYLRYIYRGNDGAPWTDDFREIIIEYGNETWHNGAGGYGWSGWGRPGYIHRGGKEYGLFARYMFSENVMQMGEWKKYNLGEKIKFALGGNYQTTLESYGESAVQNAGDIEYLGHANYVGPKWETSDKSISEFTDHGVQMALLGLHTNMKTLIESAARTRDMIKKKKGIKYNLIAYEGGPSGYWSNKDKPEIDEMYGKSVAMGVAALDTWLFSSLNGFSHQSYYSFLSGAWWSSHTMPEAGGFRPHPGWLALKLRNRYVTGDTMLETKHLRVPTMKSEGKKYPLLSSYTITDGKRYSVFLLSKKLDGVHDGLDFKDGYTSVTLRLPFDKVSKITRYRLESPDGTPVDPRVNNIEKEKVVIGSREIDPSMFASRFMINEKTGGEAGGIPPGSINLFVFETDGKTELVTK